jgi:KDO2-lipid IV(A) lauroyltransferase
VTEEYTDQGYGNFWHPRYWPTWTGFGLLWLVTRLPFPIILRIGVILGWLGYYLASGRRHIVEVNIGLCFPELESPQQKTLVRKIFRSSGISIIETALAWHRDPGDFSHLCEVKGKEILDGAINEGKGVILLGMHFSTLDLIGAVVSTIAPLDVMYRKDKNPFFDHLIRTHRGKNFDMVIDRDDIRTVIKRLKSGRVVWYGGDQDYGPKHSVFAPFFGIQTATITATARFTRITGAPIILINHYRNNDDSGYEIEFSRPLDGYPTGDDLLDATRVNQLVEASVRKCPDQYWWLHRRFKTRPEGESRPY